VRFAVDGEHRLGLRKHRSHAVVPIERCWIADPAIDGLGVTRAPWPGAEAVEAVVSSGGDRSVVVTPPDAAVVRQPPALEGLTSLVAGGEGLRQVRGRTWVREHAAGRDWRVSVGGFWQVHPGAAQALVDAVLAGISPQAGEVALDLYAGVGLFAGAVADVVGTTGSVVAVESDARAAADARRNLHTLSHVRVVSDRVERAVRSVGHERVDLVVLDPPRAGAGRSVVAAIAALGPRAVAYVACDPAALARDVATFAGLGYGLSSLRAFDCFPMTSHVECVAVLRPGPHTVPAAGPTPSPSTRGS
jgi:tRNA/tmRNA/rRNA uracil-C5-methylase (TrmA/RlmC/RlmD family)